MPYDDTVHITYEAREDGRPVSIELPFVIGVLADLCGAQEDASPPLPERRFVTADRENLDSTPAA